VGESHDDEGFKVVAERFADVSIVRYRVAGFERLPLAQKMQLHALQEAALSGRDLVYVDKYAPGLSIRRTLEAVIAHAQATKQPPSKAYDALLVYLKRIWFANGIHDPRSNRKFVPEDVTPAEFASLVRLVDPKALPRQQGESVDALLTRITPLIFDPARDPLPQQLAATATAPLPPTEPEPNTDAREPDAGAPALRPTGPYATALEECIRWLTRATTLTDSAAQKATLETLIAFYRSGQREALEHSAAQDGDEASAALIPYLRAADSQALAPRGTARVELVTAEAARRSRVLREHAAWFEEHAPIDDAFKNTQIVGLSVRSAQAVVVAGDVEATLVHGADLPHPGKPPGQQPIVLSNIVAAATTARVDMGVLQEFAASAREQARARAYEALAGSLLRELHGVLGHASGKPARALDVTAAGAEPGLSAYVNTLQEARADLVALYYLLDPELIDLKLAPSLELGRAAYDAYLRDALIELAALPSDATLRSHVMRHRQLVVQWVLREGTGSAVERLSRDGKTYYVVRDYPKLQRLFGRLWQELQRIESQGDLAAAHDLVDTLAVQIEPTLHSELRARYAALNVAPRTGFIQPELVPVTTADQIVDVRIEYPTDFATQQLRYSAKYSFLPTPP
jgi:dipeptidyl-peptidase-3